MTKSLFPYKKGKIPKSQRKTLHNPSPLLPHTQLTAWLVLLLSSEARHKRVGWNERENGKGCQMALF